MLDPKTKHLTLVLGGVRSGKSRYAQQLAEQVEHVTFIATAECRDDEEMRQKIDRHRADRPAGWTTIEEPLQLARAIEAVSSESQVIVIDCLTLYAANLLEAHGADELQLRSGMDVLRTALETTTRSVVLVSNEVGSGVVPAYALGRQFRDLVGEINQRIAEIVDTVVLMVAGLPFALKGTIAGGAQR